MPIKNLLQSYDQNATMESFQVNQRQLKLLIFIYSFFVWISFGWIFLTRQKIKKTHTHFTHSIRHYSSEEVKQVPDMTLSNQRSMNISMMSKKKIHIDDVMWSHHFSYWAATFVGLEMATIRGIRSLSISAKCSDGLWPNKEKKKNQLK